MLLLLDNRDSFVFNLDQAFRALGAETKVVRSDRITAAELLAIPASGLVLSPGPGRPSQAGCLLDVVRQAPSELPILGVCLGHQALAEASGLRLQLAPEVFHGRVSWIEHDGRGLFQGLPSPLEFARYHSLMVERMLEAGSAGRQLNGGWECSAWEAQQGVLMAMRHQELPRWGFQFHPESFRSPQGQRLLERFWNVVKSLKPNQDGASQQETRNTG